MKNKIVYIFILILFSVIISNELNAESNISNEIQRFSSSYEFRTHNLDETFLMTIIDSENVSELVAYYLYNQYSDFYLVESDLTKVEGWSSYSDICDSIWCDLVYFPIPESTVTSAATVSYVDTWGESRTYGGERTHEGTDIIANINEAGLYPIISITEGIVTNIGWLEQGGYRVGITSPSGAYFYYAHLDSYTAIEEGDTISAGQILGYMGDSGYGEEGTTGMFPVHLHLGIYINIDGEETSINPYWILRFLDTHKLKYAF